MRRSLRHARAAVIALGGYLTGAAFWRHLAAALVVGGVAFGIRRPAESASCFAYAAVLLLWANRRELAECTGRLEVALTPRASAPAPAAVSAPAALGADYLTTNALACAELGGVASTGYHTPERPGARVELHLAPGVLRQLRGLEGFLPQLEAERLLVARVLEVTVLDDEDPLPPLEQLGTTPDECRACGSREVALVAGAHGDRWACARCHALRVG